MTPRCFTQLRHPSRWDGPNEQRPHRARVGRQGLIGPAPAEGLRLAIAADDVIQFSADDALAACLGYAFATRTLTTSTRYGHPGVEQSVPKYGYRAYDCVPATPGPAIGYLDVFVTEALNGRLSQEVIENLYAAAQRAAPYLDSATERAAGRAFWELDADEVGVQPDPGSAGEALSAAWRECMVTPHVKVALTHKLLHHKAPRLVPLLDSRTVPPLERAAVALGGGSLWRVIHADLAADPEAWTLLEEGFAQQATARAGVPLNRLRLHDVLLWLHASGYASDAVTAGVEVMDTSLG